MTPATAQHWRQLISGGKDCPESPCANLLEKETIFEVPQSSSNINLPNQQATQETTQSIPIKNPNPNIPVVRGKVATRPLKQNDMNTLEDVCNNRPSQTSTTLSPVKSKIEFFESRNVKIRFCHTHPKIQHRSRKLICVCLVMEVWKSIWYLFVKSLQNRYYIS
jgi:hypothetical protein